MKIMLAAGGTGGHIYPALSLAKYLENDNHEVMLISSNNDISHEILDNQSINIKFFNLHGISREKSLNGIKQNFKTLNELRKVNRQVKELIKEFKPQVCIGFGSYISYPVIHQALKAKIPTMIHEQNSYPGLVNRHLANKVDYVLYAYQACTKFFKNVDSNKLIYVQNPRISELIPHHRSDYILFIGGSLGASRINELAVDVAPKLDIPVLLVSGSRFHVEQQVSNLTIKPYINNLLDVIKNAKVVITRGGATTLLECCSLEKNTIVIPSPNVTADHQTLNAKELADAGHLRYIPESEVDGDKLIAMINEEFKMKPFKKLDSNKIITDLIKELCD